MNKKSLLKNKVFNLLNSKHKAVYKPKEIAAKIGWPKSDYIYLRNTLKQMALRGEITRFKKNKYSSVNQNIDDVGILHVNSKGYGFVIRENGDDVFVSKKNMDTALHKDFVAIRLFAKSSGKSIEGKVIKVIKRARRNIVGTYRAGKRYGYVIPDNLKLQIDIIVDNEKETGVKDGQKVVTVIEEWEHRDLNPLGKITKIIGYPDEKGVDVTAIVEEHEIETTFPKVIESELDGFQDKISKQDIEERLDLRAVDVFTIDPVDAKDFDDAISLEKLENNHYLLGVHIADVSFYVKPNSNIDKEAEKRGTSVYLVDRVIPMLPEKLSNELCSLKEGQDRRCLSILIEITKEAKVVKYNIKESIINNKKRLTYEQAQQLIESDEKQELAQTLKTMNTLAKCLIDQRLKRGSINFETPEIKIELDPNGIPIHIHKRNRQDSHRLIEEYMLLANQLIAKHVALKLSKEHKPLPFIFRIHEKPPDDAVDNLLEFASAFGLTFKKPKKITPKYFQKLSKQFQEHPLSNILQEELIRSMTKAIYSTDNVGHFGLAYNYYTHYTSPIRRYPDLLVHRLIKQYNKNNVDNLNKKDLEAKCQNATASEIRASEAERDSIKLKQVEYMEKYLGKKYKGYISRILDFGIFVHLPNVLIDGLIHISDLYDDYYVYDDKNFSLLGVHNGKEFKLGDSVTIIVKRVSVDEKVVDFILA